MKKILPALFSVLCLLSQLCPWTLAAEQHELPANLRENETSPKTDVSALADNLSEPVIIFLIDDNGNDEVSFLTNPEEPDTDERVLSTRISYTPTTCNHVLDLLTSPLTKMLEEGDLQEIALNLQSLKMSADATLVVNSAVIDVELPDMEALSQQLDQVGNSLKLVSQLSEVSAKASQISYGVVYNSQALSESAARVANEASDKATEVSSSAAALWQVVLNRLLSLAGGPTEFMAAIVILPDGNVLRWDRATNPESTGNYAA